MTKYISVERAEKHMTACAAGDADRHRRTWVKAIRAMNDVPAADVVPVVRCRECKYCEEKSPSRLWCQNERWPGSRVPSIGYCDAGKRRDDA